MLRSKTSFLDSQAQSKSVILFWGGYTCGTIILMSLDKEIMQESSLPLEDLRAAALREDWEAVDASLSAASNKEYEAWALDGGLDDDDPNLRDLAVSILERSPSALNDNTVQKLTTLMRNDDNPYVRFRSAFALCSHDLRTPEVELVLKAAESDPDVAEIALGYSSSDEFSGQ